MMFKTLSHVIEGIQYSLSSFVLFLRNNSIACAALVKSVTAERKCTAKTFIETSCV